MAITFGTVFSDITSTANPSTLAGFTPTAGSNRAVLVHVGYTDSETTPASITSITSNLGGTFTLYGEARETGGSADICSALFYCTDFADGSQTLTVNYSETVDIGSIVAYTALGVGAGAAGPFRSATPVTGAVQAGSISINVASAVNDVVIDAMWVNSLNSGLSPAIGAGQSTIYNLNVQTDNADHCGSSEPGVAGNVAMSWSTGTTERWATVGGSLVPSVSAYTISAVTSAYTLAGTPAVLRPGSTTILEHRR